MKIYFLDGKIDYFETDEFYPDLDCAENIDGEFGYTQNMEDFKKLNKDAVVVTNSLEILDNASALEGAKPEDFFFYDNMTRTFKSLKELHPNLEYISSLREKYISKFTK